MPHVDMLGWMAAALMLLTFASREAKVRSLALATNAGFIAYGAVADLMPVLTLHLLLVPINLHRLVQPFKPEIQRSLSGSGEPNGECNPGR
jgi:hypothetical protein